MEEVVNRIKLIQVKSGLGNADFAEKLDISPATLTHLYNGRNKPSLHIIAQISQVFGVSADEIINGKQQQPPIRKSLPSQKNDVLPEARKRISSVITTYEDGTFDIFYPK
jgi:transcriptional regulator with XRE-family HTH domain